MVIKTEIALENDLEDILSMASKLEATYGHKITPPRKKKIATAIKNRLLYLAKVNSIPIGYLLVELIGKSHPHFPSSVFIQDLFVEEKFRSQGVGKKLVEFALRQKYPPGYKYFSLTHSPKKPWLTKYYENFGFEVGGKTEVGNIKLILSR